MELFLGLDEFLESASSVHPYWQRRNPGKATPAFFQTCTNVARGLGFAFIAANVRASQADMASIARDVEGALRLGVVSAYPNAAIESEFLEATRILHACEDRLADSRVSLDRVLLSCLRSHGVEKVAHIRRQFDKIEHRHRAN